MPTQAPSELRAALDRSKAALVTVAWLSALINVLLLGGPIYMLLIYDSVLPSGSFATLFGLLIMVALVYAFQALFDWLRLRILADIGAALDARMTGRVHRLVSELALRSDAKGEDGLVPWPLPNRSLGSYPLICAKGCLSANDALRPLILCTFIGSFWGLERS